MNKSLKMLIPGGILLTVGLLGFSLTKRDVEARVTSTKWIHNVSYSERVEKSSEGWGLPLFKDTFNSQCETRYAGTEACQPHSCNPHIETYRCNCRTTYTTDRKGRRSGSFERCDRCTRMGFDTCWNRCPSYRQWCTYSFYEWESRGERTFSGSSEEPNWGEEREDATHKQKRVASYLVNFVTKSGDTFTWTPSDQVEFARFSVGQTWSCKKALVGFFEPVDIAR